MRKTLLATTALAAAGAFAAGPVLAADMLSVGVSGYMEQWVGVVGVDKTENGKGVEVGDGVAQQSDTEIFFRGRLEADNGLTFSVKVELEGNTQAASQIDESQLTVRGAFGEIVMGAEDNAQTLTHHGVRSAGSVGINCGDAQKWVDGIKECSPAGFGTSGHGFGDRNQISYFSPRVSGVQFGMTYIPDTGQEARFAPLNDNDHDAFAIGGNYVGEFGGANVAFSLGHQVRAQTLAARATEKHTLAENVLKDNDIVLEKGTDIELVTQEADDATKIDEATFTNVGLQVGFGAFSFDVAYADYESGKYMPHARDANVMVEDNSGDAETMAAGAMYSDGPMAISLGFIGTEYGDGKDQALVELGGSYTLAPGVAWRSSLFMAEINGPAGTDGENSTEGTGFVTGIKINF